MTESDPAPRRRSQRVSLQVVVLMRATLPDGKTVQVQAFTVAVNAHGGRLESPVKLEANQRILLINPHSRKDVGCRVVQVEGPSLDLYDVAFEFDRRSPQFWPIAFPPQDWAAESERPTPD
jgi:hypothetical protein